MEAEQTRRLSTSDLSAMSSDTLVPSSTSTAVSRKRPIEIEANSKSKKRKSEGERESFYCHQCRQPFPRAEVATCDNMKAVGKGGATKHCQLSWCLKDLKRRYDIDPSSSGSSGESHITTCPCCSGQCQTSACRKKRGLEPLGRVSGSKKDSQTVKAKGPHVIDSSTFFGHDDDSDLSSLQDSGSAGDTTLQVETPQKLSPAKSKGKPKPRQSASTSARGTPKKKASKSTPKKQPASVTKATPKSSVKANTKSKDGKTKKGAATSREGKDKAAKAGKGKSPGKNGVAKPKPVKKPEVPPEPPAFEKVDTRLTFHEAENRIALREYLCRFRATLSIPERALMPVDDFDRPLTEASVRLFAGAMLDMVKDEFAFDPEDEWAGNTLFNFREELRYYADLARFAAIFESLRDHLQLRLPPAVAGPSTDSIELDAAQRRKSASRLPSPQEVIRMLLALAERSLATPLIRMDLDSQVAENALRRHHLSATNKETKWWEARRKKLEETRLKSKGATEGKLAKQTLESELREHKMRLSLLNVNLRAELGRHALRFEHLGEDRDGRKYLILNPRVVTDDVRPPSGWASGLLVFGRGVHDSPDDGTPVTVERWSHFGKSAGVKKLEKWVAWGYKKAVTSAKIKATRIKGLPPTTPKGAKKRLEVVIPSKRSTDSDSDSALSDLSDESDDLLELLHPEGYQISPKDLEEQGKELCRKLREVAEWLEVLEWKGMGEIV